MRETDGGMNPFDNSTSMSLTEACESSMLSSNSMWVVDSERERVRLLDRRGSQPSANQIREIGQACGVIKLPLLCWMRILNRDSMHHSPGIYRVYTSFSFQG